MKALSEPRLPAYGGSPNNAERMGVKDSRIFRIKNIQSLVPNPQSLILALCLLIGIAFAQEAPVPAPAPVTEPTEVAEVKKFAVYVSGAEAGINKSLANKLIAAVVQSDKYSEIGDIEAFNAEFVKIPNANINQITQIAKKHKAEAIVIVNLTEAFGQYSVSARLIENGDIVKTVSLDHALKSLEDLSNLSGEITAQLVPSAVVEVPPPVAVAAPVAEAAPAPAPMQLTVVEETCDTKYNKNELLYNVREGFLLGFKNCATELVKETVLAKSPLAKKPAPEPGSFITQCVMGSIKEKVDGVPGGEKITNVVENFLQTLLKAALSGGDPKALVSAAANLDITGMMETINSFAKGSSCFVDEPYEAPVLASGGGSDGDDDSFFSPGFRWGMNVSVENSIIGSQFGFVFDFAINEWFHFQPGIMGIIKGYESNYYGYYDYGLYLEIPLLMSFKLSAFRLNAGPYFATNGYNSDFGISTGLGFDIDWFYIGAFWDYGWVEQRVGQYHCNDGWGCYYDYYYNNILGLNIGVNTSSGAVGENFGVGRRIGTIALNILPGVGSLALMDDWAGAITQWGLVGGGFLVAATGNNNAVIAGVTMIVSWPFYAIYRSITYDKPKETAYNKHGSLNMAILPNSKGDGVAYGLVYRMGF